MGNIVGIIIATVFSFAFPLLVAFWWGKKSEAKIYPFIVGAICFFVFAMMLEQILHSIVLIMDNPISRFMNDHTVAMIIYGALAAGIFEETGRLFGFKVLLKKYNEKSTAVAYGIGHGGMEVVLILGVTYLVYLLVMMGLPLVPTEQAQTIRDMAGSISVSTMCFAMLERVFTMIVHVALSMLVFVAVKDQKKFWLYPLAILLHALLDTPAAIYQVVGGIPIWAIECGIGVLAVIYFFIGKRALDGYKEERNTNT